MSPDYTSLSGRARLCSEPASFSSPDGPIDGRDIGRAAAGLQYKQQPRESGSTAPQSKLPMIARLPPATACDSTAPSWPASAPARQPSPALLPLPSVLPERPARRLGRPSRAASPEPRVGCLCCWPVSRFLRPAAGQSRRFLRPASQQAGRQAEPASPPAASPRMLCN